MPLDRPTIQESDTGDAVARLQEDLVTVGYLAEGEDATGEFGPATTAAVTQLQTDSGLEQNGRGEDAASLRREIDRLRQEMDDVKRRVQ
jgi:peptidoglycan hydrolase-like protein with peptidoglycan-binding domain